MQLNAVKILKKTLMVTLALYGAVTLVMLSCSDSGTRPSETDMNPIVIRALLYAGQPVQDILLVNLAKTVHDSIMKTIRHNDNSFEQTDTVDTLIKWVTSTTIDSALVTISCNGVSYQLTFSDSGRYEDRSGNLVVTAGQTYRIDVIADGRHAWAETTVPSKAAGFSVSRDTIYSEAVRYLTEVPYDSCNGSDVCQPDTGTSGVIIPLLPDSITNLTIRWDNPDRRYFYYRCYFDPNTSSYSPGGAAEYTDRDSLTVTTSLEGYTLGYPPEIPSFRNDSTGFLLPKPGKYKLVLYSTPPEFGEMLSDIYRADSTYQDRWTESPTNVNDGIGFFTSFCIDSVFFTIVEKNDERSGGNSP